MRPSRRRLLGGLAGAGVVSLAGCIGNGDSAEESDDRPLEPGDLPAHAWWVPYEELDRFGDTGGSIYHIDYERFGAWPREDRKPFGDVGTLADQPGYERVDHVLGFEYGHVRRVRLVTGSFDVETVIETSPGIDADQLKEEIHAEELAEEGLDDQLSGNVYREYGGFDGAFIGPDLLVLGDGGLIWTSQYIMSFADEREIPEAFEVAFRLLGNRPCSWYTYGTLEGLETGWAPDPLLVGVGLDRLDSGYEAGIYGLFDPDQSVDEHASSLESWYEGAVDLETEETELVATVAADSPVPLLEPDVFGFRKAITDLIERYDVRSLEHPNDREIWLEQGSSTHVSVRISDLTADDDAIVTIREFDTAGAADDWLDEQYTDLEGDDTVRTLESVDIGDEGFEYDIDLLEDGVVVRVDHVVLDVVHEYWQMGGSRSKARDVTIHVLDHLEDHGAI